AVITLKSDRRINQLFEQFLRRMRRDFFDFHAAFGARDEDRPSGFSIHEQAYVELLCDRRALFNQQASDLATLRPGLMRHQGFAENLLGKSRHLGPILRQLDTARLPAAPRMDLGLHDIHRRVQLGGPFLSRADVLDLFTFWYSDTELREQLLRLELMNVHVAPSLSCHSEQQRRISHLTAETLRFAQGDTYLVLSSRVIWKQHRRRDGPRYTSLFGFSPELCEMIQCQPALWHGGRTGGGFRPRALAEDHQVEQRVAHETVAAMQPA